jgi:hypothetical protein
MQIIQYITIAAGLGNTPLRRLLQFQIGALITDFVAGPACQLQQLSVAIDTSRARW